MRVRLLSDQYPDGMVVSVAFDADFSDKPAGYKILFQEISSWKNYVAEPWGFEYTGRTDNDGLPILFQITQPSAR